MTISRSTRWAAVCVLFVLPLTLRLWAIDHGGPRGYVPDTHVVRAALGMARDKSLVPPVGLYSEYPNLLPYLLLPIYALEFVLGRVLGAWHSVAEFGRHMLEHPEHAAWPARVLVALFGTATVYVIYRAARAVGARGGAWIAAWLVATGLLHLHLSTHERPWVPMTFFLACSVWAAAVYVESTRLRHLVVCGACAGAAAACHQSGLPVLGVTFLAWLCARVAWRGEALRARLVHGFAAVACFALVALLVGYPARLVHGATPDHAAVGAEKIEAAGGMQIGGLSFVPQIRLASLERLSVVLVGYDPIVLLFGLLGCVAAWRVRALRPALLFTAAWAAVFLTSYSDHVRYLLPVTVLLALPAGLFIERHARTRARRIVCACLLLVPLVQAMRFDHVLARADTRALAERELVHLPADAIVAIDRYGPEVELSARALERLASLRALRGDKLRAREEHRRLLLEVGLAQGGIDAVRAEELFETDERTHTVTVHPAYMSLGHDVPSVLASLGVTHVLLVERDAGKGRANLWLGDAAPRESVWRIEPGRGARETRLPTEMGFALVDVWQVERAGPVLSLHAWP